MKFKTALTAARLRELFSYDPETGIFRRYAATQHRPAGAQAGNYTNGYVEISVDGAAYKAHRLAWLYVYGEWPAGQLDHRSLDRADNRIVNLRHADNIGNNHYQKRRDANTSGYKGVCRCKQTGRWAARIRYEGRKRHLGRFDSPEEAHEIYCLAADLIHGEFAHYG